MKKLSKQEVICYGMNPSFNTYKYDLSDYEEENTVNTLHGDYTVIEIVCGNAVVSGKVNNQIKIIGGGTADILFTDLEFIGNGNISTMGSCDKVIFGNIKTDKSSLNEQFDLKCKKVEIREDICSDDCIASINIRSLFRDNEFFKLNLKDCGNNRSICQLVSVLNNIKKDKENEIEVIANREKNKVLRKLSSTSIRDIKYD